MRSNTPARVDAFRVSDVSARGLGIARWNAAPHFVDGVERSLDGGLRYSVSGGSYEAFRDALSWEGTPPSVVDFQSAVEQAFDAWETIDPATGLGTNLNFVPDFDTPVVSAGRPPNLDGFFRLNPGAEIDILAVPVPSPFLGGSGFFADPNADSVTLTSGVANYAAAVGSGVDIEISSSRQWNVEVFQEFLTFTIGRAIGLQDGDRPDDLDAGGALSPFYDDNYDDTSSDTALATLTNSFADLIDPLDPDNSPALMLFDVCTSTDPRDPFSCAGDPGIDTPGVELVMEGFPASRRWPKELQNDDFAGRQFLYPFVPQSISGDFDVDGRLTESDINLLSKAVGTDDLMFDLNGNGTVEEDDRAMWVEGLFGTFFGDADLDKEVAFADFLALADNFAGAGGWAEGDFDGSGEVQFEDFLILSANFGQSGGATAATVPEPASVLLGMLGLLVGQGHFRRKPRVL